MKGILIKYDKQLQVYLPNNWEEANGSSARQSTVQYSTVQYMVLALLNGLGNVKFVSLV